MILVVSRVVPDVLDASVVETGKTNNFESILNIKVAKLKKTVITR